MARALFLAVAAAALAGLAASHAVARSVSGAGYTATDAVAYDWTDISGTGTAVLADAYTGGEEVGIGFDFEFYGETYRECILTPRGSVVFGTYWAPGVGVPDNYGPMPYGGYSRMASPWWDGFETTDDWCTVPGNAVYYETVGDAGSRQLIVQWEDVGHAWVEDSGAVTFQAVLYEGTDQIKFQYQDVSMENAPEYSAGASGSVGVQGDVWSTRAATAWSYNEAVLADGSAILYTPTAIPAPVSLAVDYTAETTAEAHANVMVGTNYMMDSDQAYGYDGTNSWASCDAGVFVMAEDWEERPPPEPPAWGWAEQNATMQVSCGADEGTAAVRTEARFWFDTHGCQQGELPGYGDGSGEGATDVTGTLTVGTSAEFPAGSPRLWLDVAGSDASGMLFSSHDGWLEVWDDETGEPLAWVHSVVYQTARFRVLAGQVLGFHMHSEALQDPTWEGWADLNTVFDLSLLPRAYPLDGDADDDGDVDATDLATVGLGWSPVPSGKGWADGDFDLDGDVDATDLASLGLGWCPEGYGAADPLGAAMGGTSPEPGTLVLIGLGVGWLVAVGQRRG